VSEESAITVYSDKVKECIEKIPEHIMEMSEEKLRQEVDPNIKLYEVKRSFWEEITKAQSEGRRMVVARVYRNIMHKESFYDMIKNPYAMAWIINPLTTYENRTMAALDKVTERYDELINMEITTRKKVKSDEGEWEWITEVDAKKALVLLQVIKNLEDRIKGTAVQRQVSVHTDRPSNSAGAGAGTMNMSAVEEKLKELQSKLGENIDGFGKGDRVEHGDQGFSDRKGNRAVGDSGDEKTVDGLLSKTKDAGTIELESGDYRDIRKES